MATTLAHSNFVQNSIGNVLSECMKDVVLNRPPDPIDYMARWLYKHRDNELYYFQKKLELAQAQEVLHEIKEAETDRINYIQHLKQELVIYKEKSRRLEKYALPKTELYYNEHPYGDRFSSAFGTDTDSNIYKHKKSMPRDGSSVETTSSDDFSESSSDDVTKSSSDDVTETESKTETSTSSDNQVITASKSSSESLSRDKHEGEAEDKDDYDDKTWTPKSARSSKKSEKSSLSLKAKQELWSKAAKQEKLIATMFKKLKTLTDITKLNTEMGASDSSLPEGIIKRSQLEKQLAELNKGLKHAKGDKKLLKIYKAITDQVQNTLQYHKQSIEQTKNTKEQPKKKSKDFPRKHSVFSTYMRLSGSDHNRKSLANAQNFKKLERKSQNVPSAANIHVSKNESVEKSINDIKKHSLKEKANERKSVNTAGYYDISYDLDFLTDLESDDDDDDSQHSSTISKQISNVTVASRLSSNPTRHKARESLGTKMHKGSNIHHHLSINVDSKEGIDLGRQSACYGKKKGGKPHESLKEKMKKNRKKTNVDQTNQLEQWMKVFDENDDDDDLDEDLTVDRKSKEKKSPFKMDKENQKTRKKSQNVEELSRRRSKDDRENDAKNDKEKQTKHQTQKRKGSHDPDSDNVQSQDVESTKHKDRRRLKGGEKTQQPLNKDNTLGPIKEKDDLQSKDILSNKKKRQSTVKEKIQPNEDKKPGVARQSMFEKKAQLGEKSPMASQVRSGFKEKENVTSKIGSKEKEKLTSQKGSKEKEKLTTQKGSKEKEKLTTQSGFKEKEKVTTQSELKQNDTVTSDNQVVSKTVSEEIVKRKSSAKGSRKSITKDLRQTKSSSKTRVDAPIIAELEADEDIDGDDQEENIDDDNHQRMSKTKRSTKRTKRQTIAIKQRELPQKIQRATRVARGSLVPKDDEIEEEDLHLDGFIQTEPTTEPKTASEEESTVSDDEDSSSSEEDIAVAVTKKLQSEIHIQLSKENESVKDGLLFESDASPALQLEIGMSKHSETVYSNKEEEENSPTPTMGEVLRQGKEKYKADDIDKSLELDEPKQEGGGEEEEGNNLEENSAHISKKVNRDFEQKFLSTKISTEKESDIASTKSAEELIETESASPFETDLTEESLYSENTRQESARLQPTRQGSSSDINGRKVYKRSRSPSVSDIQKQRVRRRSISNKPALYPPGPGLDSDSQRRRSISNKPALYPPGPGLDFDSQRLPRSPTAVSPHVPRSPTSVRKSISGSLRKSISVAGVSNDILESAIPPEKEPKVKKKKKRKMGNDGFGFGTTVGSSVHDSETQSMVSEFEDVVERPSRMTLKSRRSTVGNFKKPKRKSTMTNWHTIADKQKRLSFNERNACSWKCTKNSTMICQHPSLGDIMPRPSIIPREMPDEWAERGFVHHVVYDHEVYTNDKICEKVRKSTRKSGVQWIGLTVQDFVIPGPWIMQLKTSEPLVAKDQYTMHPSRYQLTKLVRTPDKMPARMAVLTTCLAQWPAMDTSLLSGTTVERITMSYESFNRLDESRKQLIEKAQRYYHEFQDIDDEDTIQKIEEENKRFLSPNPNEKHLSPKRSSPKLRQTNSSSKLRQSISGEKLGLKGKSFNKGGHNIGVEESLDEDVGVSRCARSSRRNISLFADHGCEDTTEVSDCYDASSTRTVSSLEFVTEACTEVTEACTEVTEACTSSDTESYNSHKGTKQFTKKDKSSNKDMPRKTESVGSDTLTSISQSCTSVESTLESSRENDECNEQESSTNLVNKVYWQDQMIQTLKAACGQICRDVRARGAPPSYFTTLKKMHELSIQKKTETTQPSKNGNIVGYKITSSKSTRIERPSCRAKIQESADKPNQPKVDTSLVTGTVPMQSDRENHFDTVAEETNKRLNLREQFHKHKHSHPRTSPKAASVLHKEKICGSVCDDGDSNRKKEFAFLKHLVSRGDASDDDYDETTVNEISSSATEEDLCRSDTSKDTSQSDSSISDVSQLFG